MIRFRTAPGPRDEPILVAEGEPHSDYPSGAVTSASLADDRTRHAQARALIDAAAALLEDDVGYEAAFDALHDVLDDLPQAQREAP